MWGFRRNWSTVDHILSIRQILEKKWEYNKDVCQLFIGFEKAYDSIKRESLYDILIKFGVQKKVRLIKICLDGTQNKVRIGNYLSSSFPIENGLKPGDALSPLLFNFLLLFCPSWSCTIICCINRFTSLCKNLFNLLEF